MTPLAESVFKAAYDSHLRAGADETVASLRAYRVLEEAGIEKHSCEPVQEPEEVEKFSPPAEIQAAAKSAFEAGAVVEGITESLAMGIGLSEEGIRKIDAYFAAAPTDAGVNSYGGRHAEKWALRVLRKIQTRETPDSIELQGTICKVDEAQHLVFGWFSVTHVDGRPVTDVQGDRISVQDIEKSGYDFVLKSRVGGAMHEKSVGKLVESVVITPEKTAAMVESLKKQGIQASIDLPVIGWWGGFKIADTPTWEAITKGELKAFSIGGTGKRVPLAA